jgi:hypothetical protein
MKKAYSTLVLLTLVMAHSAMGHSTQVVHLHPHGENSFLTTGLVAATIAILLGGRYFLQRRRQR